MVIPLRQPDPSVLALQRHIARVRALNAPRPVHKPTLRLISATNPAPEPCFGGEDDPAPKRRKTVTVRLQRVQARAAVFLSPETLCSSQDIADIFGIRESEARSLRPASARQIGRSLMAPFAEWHLALLGPQPFAPPRETRRASAPRLLPLGGPGRK